MKTHSSIMLFFSLLIASALTSCSGGGGGGTENTSTDIVSNPQSESVALLFPEVDTDELLVNPPSTKIDTVSSNAEIHTTYTQKDKVEIDISYLLNEYPDTNMITFLPAVDLNDSQIGSALFVSGVFKGMILDTIASNSNVLAKLEDANELSDVYESFDIIFQNDAIAQSIKRSLAVKDIKGRFDDINKDPLKISLLNKVNSLNKSSSNTSSLTNDNLVLRIDIPKGYTIPIETRSISCTFSTLDCTLTTQGESIQNLDLGKSYGENGLTFSTEGSYIEIGIGTYLRAHYDYNYIGADTFDFDLAQSAYFESNLSVTLSGELEKSWEVPLKLLYDFVV